MNECCAVVDLRQYTLHPGHRDALIEVFDTYLVEGQEQTGMHIVGQFRDLDDPDRFVWIRGFRDLPARADALNAFYYGPVWRAHSAAANVTMIDSDNALLLKPVRLGPGYPALDAPRAGDAASSMIGGAVYHRAAEDDGFVEFFTDQVVPVLAATGAEPVAVFESLVAENNFPQLPLRDEVVLTWFARFADDTAYDEHRRRLADSRAWQERVLPELVCRSAKPVQELRLRPTGGSQFR
ncbi:NIPSNAP family protein [Kribbella speibonae]|uniref:NIPSNAP family containing protein n=1 Tax=Kribbella speibonae TaxID=1572660 RepID=A0ABY2AG62_9ACTN|nr:NIPSNAP family protein [Kribbella speibonae]TCC28032.1 NIPSNAP family containing protein [Kribbella speibonae]